MIEFANPWAWVLLVLPPVAWFALSPMPARMAVRVPSSVWHRLSETTGTGTPAARLTKSGLWIKAGLWLALVSALAGPQTLGAPLVKPTGRDLLIAVDLSASMGVPFDKADSRSPKPIKLIRNFLDGFIADRRGDRMGLIGFASEAYLITPLTHDAGAIADMLAEVRIGLPGRRTDLGQAVGQAVRVFGNGEAESKVVLLVSDGESNAGALSVNDAARLAKQQQITFYTIGFAKTVKSVNADLLKEIAATTGGQYFEARSPDELEGVTAAVGRLQPAEQPNDPPRLRQDWRWVPLCAALGVLSILCWREVRRA